ncbi:hypothetical protein EJP77_14010 [Paenibacillus zeisoli]|uniref:DUF4064 domain-containing protein n=1 Tax=Paenibacillus zeisoli TaxID=2496267 RepID=A0A3S1JM79_9BACL|nr:hypothetical protein [Paenibacillus zeisoli]RUT29494.1 hypothetical protein EJP77_14010 [Paenibacillus zeisoli]
MEFNTSEMNTSPDPTYKHSGPGIASFVISLVALIAYVAAIVTILVTTRDLVHSGLPITNDLIINHAGFLEAGLIVIAAIILTLVGCILGIIGLALKNRKKVFAILGVVISALPPAFMLILALIRTS